MQPYSKKAVHMQNHKKRSICVNVQRRQAKAGLYKPSLANLSGASIYENRTE
jgi:hypothetical protein